MDHYFTSSKLADWVTTKHFSIVGTIRLDRKGIPKEIKSLERREETSKIFAYQSDSLLVSYVDKKKASKKNIVMTTTMHTSVSVTKNRVSNQMSILSMIIPKLQLTIQPK